MSHAIYKAEKQFKHVTETDHIKIISKGLKIVTIIDPLFGKVSLMFQSKIIFHYSVYCVLEFLTS